MKGQITISRPMRGDHIVITCDDDASGVQFVEIKINLADFARVVTGLGHVDCEFTLRPKYVGMTREHKTEIVQYALGDDQDEVLKPYEVDGWVANRRCLGNIHSREGQHLYKVTFHRFVTPDSVI